MAKEVVYEKVKQEVFDGAEKMTIEKAKEIIGWRSEVDAGVQFGDKYFLRDAEGVKVVINNNATNRPFRIGLAKRYANEMLRGKWQLNGEAIIVDKFGNVQSGQHRLIGFILAEQMRRKDKEKWGSTPLKLPILVVYGISDKPEVVDTLDQGQKRTLPDVIFRNREFGNKTPAEQKALAGVLGVAIRLVWLRVLGQKVSDAPHFPHSEALEFFGYHPLLLKAVQFILNEDNGRGADGQKISKFISLGYAAGLLYLMGTAKSVREEYDESGTIDESLWEKAEEFWVKLASGEGLKKGDPILALRNYLTNKDASSGKGRDELIGTVVKAFNLFVDGKDGDAKAIKVLQVKDKDTGKFKLGEDPRIGGLDVYVEPPAKPVKEPKAPKEKKVGKRATPKNGKVGTKAGDHWQAGDTCWVEDPDEPWFGEIVERTDKGLDVRSEKDGAVYEVEFDAVSLNKPKLVAAAA